MARRSNFDAVAMRYARARMAGLIAAAQTVLTPIRRELRKGFAGGAFRDGNSALHATRSEPDLARGEIRVGTDLDYNLYWEVGHLNIFMDGPIEGVHGVRTAPIRRKEVWGPALVDHAERMRAAYARAFDRVWNGGTAA
jgi:hypothetical protein